jgi:pyocin large subunit-like protein
MLLLVVVFFGGQFLGWWEMPSLINLNVAPPAAVTQTINDVLKPPKSAKIENVWTPGAQRDSESNAIAHFKKHGHEFPFSSHDEYIRAALDFILNPPPGTLSVVQSDGDHVYYNEQKNYFAVTNRTGNIRTFFRLDPDIHGYPTNMDYFRAQERR